jgi:hypothetical protein
MAHLLLTSALVVALLVIVGIAIGACLGIARDLMLDGAEEEGDDQPDTATNGPISLSEKIGVGLRHAATFAQTRGGSFRGDRSRDA